MKKLVTALIIVLPFVLLISLFALTSVASVSADIPANGLVINNKGAGVFSFDLANYQNRMYEKDLGVEVLPYMAKNKTYSLSVTDANTGEKSDIVTLEKDGSFALHDVGVAKLTYTSNDGGYSDSVVFNVGSSGVLSYVPSLKDAVGNTVTLSVGDDTDFEANIEVGSYVLSGNYYPSTATNIHASYKSENDDKIQIDEVSGKINAYFETNGVVSIFVKDAFGNDVEKKIRLIVSRSGDLMINGQRTSSNRNDTASVTAPLGTTNFTLFVDCKDVKNNDIRISGAKSADYRVRKLYDVSDSAYAVDVTLNEPVNSPMEGLLYSVRINGNPSSTRYFKLSFADYAFSVNSLANADGNDDLVVLDETTTRFVVSSNPDDGLTYTWRTDDPSVAEISEQSGKYCHITAIAQGKTQLRIDWQKIENGTLISNGTITRNLIVTKSYASLIFNEAASSHGLGKLAIANRKFENGTVTDAEYVTKLFNNVIGKDQSQEEIEYPFDDIVFKSSNDSVLSPEKTADGVKFIVKDTGEVTITAEWIYGDRFGAKATSITVNAVNGVYVNTYDELKIATEMKKQIVLQNDIYLGEKLTDEQGNLLYSESETTQKLLSFVKTIKTTGDYKYYSNLGEEQPNVYVCFEFENDVYGNGHFVSAEYITNMRGALTDTVPSYALFKGPLNFVAANMSGIDIASVKAQDNISFLVRKNGIVLDNVTLAGCDDSSLYVKDKLGNSKLELALLNEKGTTLEVMCDATVRYCRIKNGRTVVRVFGKSSISASSVVNPQRERINATFDGCRMHTAREFVLKIGTNRILRGNADDLAPSFVDSNGNAYTDHNSVSCDKYANDKYFTNNYVLTDVTLKDSILSTSGLFSVGVESHFSGSLLDMPTLGFNYLKGWDGLAATSYPACLRLVGNVILDDWKELTQVDSSTLIEVNLKSDQQSFGWLQLNIPQMLKEVCKQPGYGNIISTIDGKDYVHGGIALYGGGKNYSIIDTSKYTFESMSQYLVNIGVLENSTDETLRMQGQMLPMAAGGENFRFVMFDATSKFNATNNKR
ncbi:MAG TPA: hypothetical protein DD626_01265 [Clostridiales bacterium]|nr:hypothetical protein [Clostridiales bacterium]